MTGASRRGCCADQIPPAIAPQRRSSGSAYAASAFGSGLFWFAAVLQHGIDGSRINALDGFALFGKYGKVKPELRHGDPVALRLERVRFLRKPEAVTGVISELV
jgi:hypothetical protein